MATEPLQKEIAKLEAPALLSFFVLDATDIGGGFFRFYPGTDFGAVPVVFQGNEYAPFPMEFNEMEIKSAGAPPRPTLVVSNYNNAFSALVVNFDDLIGARLTRLRTFDKFLDGRPDADPTAVFPIDRFKIERKSREDSISIEFELGADTDVDDVYLPKRIVYSTLCAWRYRSSECGFVSNIPIADLDNQVFPAPNDRGEWLDTSRYYKQDSVYMMITGVRQYFYCYEDSFGAGVIGEENGPTNAMFWKKDQCSKSTIACKLRYGASVLPHGGFPGTNRFPF